MIIIDRTQEQNPPKKLKPIRLIGCLQASLCDGKFSFSAEKNDVNDDFPKWPTPYGMNKIERIYEQQIDGEWYDVMIIGRKNQSPCLFIGQWNDGIWEE